MPNTAIWNEREKTLLYLALFITYTLVEQTICLGFFFWNPAKDIFFIFFFAPVCRPYSNIMRPDEMHSELFVCVSTVFYYSPPPPPSSRHTNVNGRPSAGNYIRLCSRRVQMMNQQEQKKKKVLHDSTRMHSECPGGKKKKKWTLHWNPTVGFV